MLMKKKAADKTLLLAHRLVFGRPGEAGKRKADLRLFNGLPASPSAKADLEKKLGGQTVPALRDLSIFFNLERSGEKNAMAARLAEFLLSPKDFGKSKAVASVAKKTATGKKAATKRKSSKAEPKAKKAKASANNNKKLSPEQVDSEDEDFAEEIASLKAAGKSRHAA